MNNPITFAVSVPITVRIYDELPEGVTAKDIQDKYIRCLNYYSDGRRSVALEALENLLPDAARMAEEALRAKLWDKYGNRTINGKSIVSHIASRRFKQLPASFSEVHDVSPRVPTWEHGAEDWSI